MPIYLYRARNMNGDLLEGQYEAATENEIKFMLNEKGYFATEIRKKPEAFTINGLFQRVNIRDIAIFCRQFSVILGAGITIVEAIGVLRDQAEKKKFYDVLDDIHDELQKGRILSECLDLYPDIFPEFLRSMVKVGEASGSLDVILVRLAEYYERENRIRKKISTAMAYPTILLSVTLGVIIILLVFVLPMFADILNDMGGELPLITKIIIGISNFFVNNIIMIFLLTVIAVTGISYWLKSESGKNWFDGFKLSIPVVRNTVKKVLTSRFSRSMGILLKSGIPIIEAIDLMSSLLGNNVVKKRFDAAKELVREGHGISGPIRQMEFFPSMLIHMVAIGEKTGELDEMLTRTAGFFDEEVESAVDKMTTLLEPLMLVILAVIVGFILISVMLPMVNIMDSVV